MKTAAGGCHLEAAGAGCHVEHTLTAHKRDGHAIGFTKQRVEHVARSIAVGKQLAAGLFVKRHAELPEKHNCLVHRKRLQHAPHDGRSPAPEVPLGDDRVGDVAAGAAAHENFRARFPCGFDQHNRSRAILPPREDCRREAGCTGSDNRHIVCEGKVRQMVDRHQGRVIVNHAVPWSPSIIPSRPPRGSIPASICVQT